MDTVAVPVRYSMHRLYIHLIIINGYTVVDTVQRVLAVPE